MRCAGYNEKMIGRTYFGGDQVTQLNLVLYNTIKWPYQPKHSPSLCSILYQDHNEMPQFKVSTGYAGLSIGPDTMLVVVMSVVVAIVVVTVVVAVVVTVVVAVVVVVIVIVIRLMTTTLITK